MPSRHRDQIRDSENKPANMVSNDFLRQGLHLLVQLFIELEISSQIEAFPHERNQSRRSYRNGYRRRSWTTSLGEITLEIPKLRKGTYYPAFLPSLHFWEPTMLDLLRDTYHKGADLAALRHLAGRVGVPVSDSTPIADSLEHLYDLVDRYRQKRSLQSSSNIITYRPVAAIATLLVDTHIDDEKVTPCLYLYAWQSEVWLVDSLNVLTRIRHILLDDRDAVAA